MLELFAGIWALVHWRLMLCVIGSAAITLTLSKFFIGFTAGYCISFILLGSAVGMYWQSRSEAGIGMTTRVPEPKISWPIAFLGLSFVGLIWGGLVTELLKSEVLAVISLVVAVAVVCFWSGVVQRRPVPLQKIVFSAGALLSGFLAVLIVFRLNA
jgi:hypothetical protein